MSDMDKRSRMPEWRETTSETDSLSVSKQCELLASDQRRAVLRYLMGRPGEPVHIGKVVDYLLSQGKGTDRQNMLTALQHSHLPKLATAGVITYDRDQRRLTYRRAPALERLVDFLGSQH